MIKTQGAYKTISQVAQLLDVPTHVLRFWEKQFASIAPVKRSDGRRYYRDADIELIRKIKDCLYKDGYTIKGVQRLLAHPVAEEDVVPVRDALSEENVQAFVDEIRDIQDYLKPFM